MAIIDQLNIIVQLLVAIILGGCIGFERERDGKSAGIRTYAAVCLGASLYCIVGLNLMDMSGTSRIVANIVTGVGFLGAGIIFRDTSHERTSGLTTAATVWATAAVGVAVGYELYFIAVAASAIIYFLLAMHHFKWFITWTKKLKAKYELEERDHHENE